jgi:hypothetical protein
LGIALDQAFDIATTCLARTAFALVARDSLLHLALSAPERCGGLVKSAFVPAFEKGVLA